MVLELCVATLVEAAIGVIKSSLETREPGLIINKLEDMSAVISDMQGQLTELKEELITNDDPEVLRFERARSIAARQFCREWDHSLLDFATEILSSVMDDCLAGVRIQIISTVLDANMAMGFREASFDAVVMASKSVAENSQRLNDFFQKVLIFNALLPIPLRKRPQIIIRLALGGSDDFEQFDRIRSRIILRLAFLSTIALNWAEHALGCVIVDKVYVSRSDESIFKYVVCSELSHSLVKTVRNRALAGYNHEEMCQVWWKTIKSGSGSVRIIALSQDNWREEEHRDLKRISGNIRTYTDKHGVKWMEIKVAQLDDWDRTNLKRAIFHELSTSILVFRFSSLTGLQQLVSMSKDITDMFCGLTTEQRRIMYVDTRTRREFGKMRWAIRDLARRLRLLEPRDEVDILFEAHDRVQVCADVSCRAKEMRSILCNWYGGRVRGHLETIVRILNREIGQEEMTRESMELAKFVMTLQSTLRTKMCILHNPNTILIVRGDSTGFNLRSRHCYQSRAEWRDFRDVSKHAQITARIVLRDVPDVVLQVGLLSSNWTVMRRVRRMVEEGRLFMAVAGERMSTLNRGDVGMVTGVGVTVFGGGVGEFLYGKLVRECARVLGVDGGWMGGIRALLRIAPELGEVVRRSKRLCRQTSNWFG